MSRITQSFPLPSARRWVSVTDSNADVWLFDASFMLSGFHCIYGQGCPSIELEPDHTEALGCCVHGAHFVDEDDLTSTAAYAALLTDEQWQFRPRAIRKGGAFKKKKKSGDWVTRKADGACIFLNRAGFPGGAGCALHRAALEREERPLDWKPDVCWQVPIRLDIHTDDYGKDTTFIKSWDRSDWGEGGEDFHWWCTEAAEAFTNTTPLYQQSRDELTEMVGQEVYEMVAAELDAMREEQSARADGLSPTEVPVDLTARP